MGGAPRPAGAASAPTRSAPPTLPFAHSLVPGGPHSPAFTYKGRPGQIRPLTPLPPLLPPPVQTEAGEGECPKARANDAQ